LLASLALALAISLSACGGSGGGNVGVVDWPSELQGVETGAAIGQRAPNFRLETATGDEVTLAEEVGQPVLINFWATWCPNCREEMAALEAAHREGAAVVGINLRESADAVKDLAAETQTTFPLVLDPKGTVTRAFKVTNLPVTVVIDADGVIREVVHGPVDEERIREMLAAAAAGGGA
jgi:peroxiredoxin